VEAILQFLAREIASLHQENGDDVSNTSTSALLMDFELQYGYYRYLLELIELVDKVGHIFMLWMFSHYVCT
jgi:hypothetical protein